MTLSPSERSLSSKPVSPRFPRPLLRKCWGPWRKLTPAQKLGLLDRIREQAALRPAPVTYAECRRVIHPTRGKVPFHLYPYQRRLLTSDAPERLILKARQIGISQLIAAEALFSAKHYPGRTILFVSRNLEAAQHLQRLVYRLLETDPVRPEVRRQNERELLFANDSSLLSLPASEETGRTYAASAVYLDEFAHTPWAEQIYQAVAPCVSRGGRLTVISTPKGKANLFYRLYQETILGGRSFQLHRLDWTLCPEYNPRGFALENPEARRRLGEGGDWFLTMRPRYSDQQWAEEFECDFSGSAGLVYREFDPELHVIEYHYRPEWPTFVGQDFGYTNPAVAIFCQVSPSEDVFVFEESYLTNRPISALAREVYAPLAARYRVLAWYCDPAGPAEIAELRAAGLPAAPARNRVDSGLLALRNLLRPPGTGGWELGPGERQPEAEREQSPPDPRPLAPNPFPEKPRLFISRRCVRLIAELASYAYRDGTEEPLKENDHGPDALRYFITGHWAGQAEAEGLSLR